MLRALRALTLALAVACGGETVDRTPESVDSGFAAVHDSVWVNVDGVALIAFYPLANNEQLVRDADLATALDDFSYHLGSAMDSLEAAEVAVHYRGGDTIWVRSGDDKWRFVRHPDSADVGYLFADSDRHHAAVYGVRTYVDLTEYAHEFKRTGRIAPR